MWPILTLLGLGAAGYFYWQGKRLAQELEAAVARQRDENSQLREQHQQTLAEEQAKLETLFNSMVEGVLVLDNQSRILLINHACERLFDLQGDIRKQTLMEALRLHELQNLAQRVTREGHVQGFELDLPGVENRCLQINGATFLNREGKSQGIILIFHDLTRIKQLENTRKEFVANVSHELRTPLSLIKGYVETLIDGAKDDSAVAERFLQTIEKHADRLTYLIEDLLTISRLESGQVVLNLQPTELQPLVERVMDDLHSRAEEKRIILANEVPLELQVNADADRLQQVLFNLVDNAIKYGRIEGKVIVQAKQREDQMVEVSVSDNGPGIPPEATERVFERFYRVDRARSRDQGGTGLGLSIVKHIVQSHNGEVWVDSEVGKGTTFRFTLPLAT